MDTTDFISVPKADDDKNIQLPTYNEALDFPAETDKYRQLYTGKLYTPGGAVQNITVVQPITKNNFWWNQWYNLLFIGIALTFIMVPLVWHFGFH